MGGSTSSGSSESTNTSEVWGAQSPFLESLYQQGSDLYQQFAPQTQVPGAAQTAWQQQLNPQANPYLSDMTQIYRDELGLANQASGGEAGLAGAYGGGRQGIAEAQNMQNYSSQIGSFLGQQTQLGLDQQANAIDQTSSIMGMDPWQQQMAALQQSGTLLGGPTILGEGSSNSSNSSMGLSMK